MYTLLDIPLPIALTAIWLLVLPLIVNIERRIQRFTLKSSLSVMWAVVVLGSAVEELLRQEGVHMVETGNRVPGTSIEFKISPETVVLLIAVLFLFACVMLFSWHYLRWETMLDDEGEYKLYYYFLFYSVLLGFEIVLFSNDAFFLFVGWEFMVIPGYALVALRPNRKAADAGMKYALLSSVGSVFILYAVSLLYYIGGNFNLDVIRNTVSENPTAVDSTGAWFAITFTIVGIGVTAGFIGLHTWIPDAYTSATSPVGAFLSGTFTIASVVAYQKLLLSVFPAQTYHYSQILIWGGVASMTVGNLSAIRQRDARRILGYSSLAQRGYILFGIGTVAHILESGKETFMGQEDIKVVYLFALTFAVLEGILFLIVGKVLYVSHYRTTSRGIDELQGCLKKNPYTSLMFIIAALGLAGLPPSLGFVSKLSLIFLVGDSGLYQFLLLLFLLNSVLSLIYYLNLVDNILLKDPAHEFDTGLTPKTVDLAIVLMTLVSTVVGIVPALLLEWL